MGKRYSRLVLWTGYFALFGAAVCMDLWSRVQRESSAHVTEVGGAPERFTGIVLGCRVSGEEPSGCLEERLACALSLYRAGRIQRLLLSGDHGRRNYDEVNTMRAWLVEQGVPVDRIFLDHAGFDTYDTMVRAKRVFQVDGALIISQRFHLPRAIFIARRIGLDAVGIAADPERGSVCGRSGWREPLASVKAVLNIALASKPHFLGPAIPITGSAAASWDR